MPGPSSEPDKYSIDDMMERLTAQPQEGGHPNGEVVTRADGTTAIRVRKRKRRSSQPHKEQEAKSRRLRLTFIVAGVVAVLAILLAVGGLVVYSNSAPFRNHLTENLGKRTGAVVKFQQFRMSPAGANAQEVRMKWPADHVLDSILLNRVQGAVSPSSFLGDTFSGEELTASEGSLDLRSGKQGPLSGAASTEPFPVSFERYGIHSMSIRFGETAAIHKTEMSFYPRNGKGNSEIRLNRGDFSSESWPSLRVNRGLLEVRGRDLEIISLGVFHNTDERGSLTLSGTVHPMAPDQESTLQVNAESFLLSGIVGEDLERFIAGRIDTRPSATSNYLVIQPSSKSPAKLVTEWAVASGSQIEVANFQFLFALSQTTHDGWYEHPMFPEIAQGSIRREGKTVVISDLKLLAKSRMAIKGTITVGPEKALSGELQVGLTDGMIQTAASARLSEIFGSEEEDGFRWMTVRLSGTTDAPKDDFKDQFASTSRKDADKDDYKPSSFEELTRPK